MPIQLAFVPVQHSSRNCRWLKSVAWLCCVILVIAVFTQACSTSNLSGQAPSAERFSRGSISTERPFPGRAKKNGVNDRLTDSREDSKKLPSKTDAWLKRFSYKNNPTPLTVEEGYQSSESVDADVVAPAALSQTTELFDVDAVKAPADALLFSLASDAGLQLQINGQLKSSLTLTARQLPLVGLMKLIAQQADFSWEIAADRITVWTGAAYGRSYPVNYLNMNRRTQSSVGLATQVGTINATDGTSNTVANSSQTRIENTSEHLFWDSLKVDVEGLLEQDDDAFTSSEYAQSSRFSINREAGLLTLYAVPSIHRTLVQYLDLLHSNTQRQVLIEATVVEVALSKSFEAGVDWQVLANGINGVNAAQILMGVPAVTADNLGRVTAPAGLISLVQQGGNGDLRATLSLLEQFGDVRILSRPRIIALNNQSSVLKVVDNRVYFTLNVQRRQSDDKDEIVTETEIHTVPVGLVMNVTPHISEQGDVILNVRPTLSRILGFVNDPNPELALANVRNGVPEIQVREMESMLQVHSGDVAIIGGLMQETLSDDDVRLPGLSRIPGLGRLFSSKKEKRQQTELLIVLRPTVLTDSSRTVSR